MKLDSVHRAMIEALQRDGRMSINALAEHLGISRSNAYQRFERLVAEGIIRGFSAQVSPPEVGLPISALVFVTLDQRLWPEFRAGLSSIAELEYFAVTTGGHDCMLLIRSASVTRIHTLVSLELASWESVKSTETVFLMDEQWSWPELPDADAPAATQGPALGQETGMTRFIRQRRPAPGE